MVAIATASRRTNEVGHASTEVAVSPFSSLTYLNAFSSLRLTA